MLTERDTKLDNSFALFKKETQQDFYDEDKDNVQNSWNLEDSSLSQVVVNRVLTTVHVQNDKAESAINITEELYT